MSNEILKTYKNSTSVVSINGYQVKVEDLVFASLIGGMNLLLVSERGKVKPRSFTMCYTAYSMGKELT